MARGQKAQSGKLRWECKKNIGGERIICYTTTDPSAPARDQLGHPTEGPGIARRVIADTKRYIVTAAQNATPVHTGFLETLKVAARHLDAELVVIPLRYKNATSSWTASQANAEVWAPEVVPFLYAQRKKLGPNIVLVGDVKIQPTAVSPLTGFEGLTHGESSIFGHTKIQLRVVPVAPGKFPKIMTTTGAVTIKNYTDSRAGKLGEFHHSLGAVIVEIDGKEFHLRHIQAADDGSFTDLDVSYDTVGKRPAAAALGLVMGDWHHRFHALGVLKATFGKDGMVETLNPQYLVWHDADDGYSHNPHHEGNPFIAKAKLEAGYNNVRNEITETIAFINHATGERNSVVVASNHDDFLRRWIIDTDWREDPENADFYFETALAMWQSAHVGKGGTEYLDPFAYWLRKLSTNPGVRALDKDESFKLARFECGMHGHRGPNGVRGSIKNLSRLGSLVISGHGHTPGWEEGHRRVGTSAERMEYEEGPSSHLQTHCVVYDSGASCLLTVIGDKWRLRQ